MLPRFVSRAAGLTRVVGIRPVVPDGSYPSTVRGRVAGQPNVCRLLGRRSIRFVAMASCHRWQKSGYRRSGSSAGLPVFGTGHL